MTNLFTKILVSSLFFLVVPVFAVANFDINFGSQVYPHYQDSGVGVYKDSEAPIILPRNTWEDSPELKSFLDWYPACAEASADKPSNEENKPPDYSSVERVIIHDMGCNIKQAGCNDKEISPITIIQNIYRYHAVTRGWGDIGYHYIIDYWGNIYEGRYGGNGVRGAHTYYDRKCDNFNIGSVGILLMGNYENTELPEVMYKSLVRLVAWIAATNDLEPANISHTSEIWHSPNLSAGKAGKNSGCDISQGGLTSIYTGPVVVGHGDIEQGNSDPGLVNLKRVRQEADELYTKYKNYVYTVKDDLKVYSIKNGVVLQMKEDVDSQKVVVLNKNQLDLFPFSVKTNYSDGTLVQSFTRDRVYFIEKNKRRPIFSEKLFNLRKFSWSDIKFLSDRDLAAYSLGAPLTYPDKVLIKGETSEVYLLENGKRRHISSAILFNQMGFKWKDIIQISQLELLAHPLGEKFLFADGVLIREEKSSPIYLIKNQQKHWIKTLQAFLSLSYKWEDVISLSSEEIGHYPVGSVINTADDIAKLEMPETKEEIGQIDIVDKIDEHSIRIGIYEVSRGNGIKIKANGPYEVYQNNILLASKKTGETTIITYSTVYSYKFLSQSKDTIFEIISYEDHPEWNPQLNDNRFRGIIEIKYSPESKKLWIINELSLENYLKGVAEALNNDPIEYLKAFTIAARSYALFHIQNGGKTSGEVFHLRNWAYDQLYKGYGFEKRASNIAKAVEETNGIVATCNNNPIRGVYSSDSGGTTKNACQIFKGVFCSDVNYAYLDGGVKDPEGTIHSKAAIAASHGVGMSSAGARQLAKIGKNFEEILKYYYLGIEVEKLY